MERGATHNESAAAAATDVAGVLTRDGHLVSMCEPERAANPRFYWESVKSNEKQTPCAPPDSGKRLRLLGNSR